MARSNRPPSNPLRDTELIAAIDKYAAQLKNINESTHDEKTKTKLQESAFKETVTPELIRYRIVPANSGGNLAHRDFSSPLTLIEKTLGPGTRANALLVMNMVADKAALANIGSPGDAITRYPLNVNSINTLTSSSLLVLKDSSGVTKGIFHVEGDQFRSNLEYKPITPAQGIGLLDEAIQSAQQRDRWNIERQTANYTAQEPRFQASKTDFIKNAAHIEALAQASAATMQANPSRNPWAQYYEQMNKKTPASQAFKSAYDSFWNRVINHTEDFISGNSRLLHEQAVLLNAAKGSKDWQNYLFLIEQDGAPKIFLATADLQKHAVFNEISAAEAMQLASSGYQNNSAEAQKAANSFMNVLHRHAYPLLTPEPAKININIYSSATLHSPGNRQSGYAYAAAPEWINPTASINIKQGLSSIMDSAEHAMNKSPAIPKALGIAGLAPAVYDIAQQSYEAGKESIQSGLTVAAQGASKLTAALEAGALISPYALPMLATPYGELSYLGYTALASTGGSLAMQSLENGTMWAWQKLAVEPLQAQADARAAEKSQQEVAQQKHLAILGKIPDTLSPEREAAQRQHARIMSLIPGTPSPQQLMARQIVENAAKNGLSIEGTCTALNAASCHFTGSAAESSHAADASSPAPHAQESLNQ